MKNSEQPGVLPSEFHFSHDFCFFLHDILVDIVKSGEEQGIFNYKYVFKSKEEADVFSSLKQEDLWDWMSNNNVDLLKEVTYRQICVALLTDFCNFVYEALTCSRKGKLTVAYALLRKPFKENLFYFEWLLADRADFLEKFLVSDSLTLPPIGDIPKERKIEIIKKAQEASDSPWGDDNNDNFIFALRYDRKADFGFAVNWDQAAHLITNFKSAQTEPQNFNFVFSNPEDHSSQWEHIYTYLPILLDYAVDVVETVVSNIADTPDEYCTTLYMRRAAGFLLWAHKHGKRCLGVSPLQEAQHFMRNIHFVCPICTRRLEFRELNLPVLYESASITCPACGAGVDPSTMQVDEDAV